MKFNGVDPRSLHRAISINKEIPPGTAASQLETLSGATGEIIVGRTIQQGEYIVRVNIAAKSKAEAWEVRRLLAAWARPTDSQTRELVPTHWPSVAYDAILKEISPPEFVFGFATVDVIFALPRPIAHDRTASIDKTDAEELTVKIGGTSYARPAIRATVTQSAPGLTLYVDGEICVRIVTPVEAGDVITIGDDAGIDLYDASAGTTVDAADRVDYTQTDIQGMWERLTPGRHTLHTAPKAALEIRWRSEWV